MNKRLLAAVATFLFIAPILLGTVSAAPPFVFGVPRSDRVVSGEIGLPGPQPVRFVAREGTVVSIQDSEKHLTAGFSPAILGESQDEVAFLILELTGSDLEDVQQFGTVSTVNTGASSAVDTPLGSVVLSVGQVARAAFPPILESSLSGLRPTELRQRFGRTGGGTCCVTCGSLTSCGSAIQMECGACETGPVELE